MSESEPESEVVRVQRRLEIDRQLRERERERTVGDQDEAALVPATPATRAQYALLPAPKAAVGARRARRPA